MSRQLDRSGLGRRSAIDYEGFARSRACMNSMNQPFVVNIFRRHRPLGGDALVFVGVGWVVAHNTKLSVAPSLAVGGEHGVTDVAVLNFHCLSAWHSFIIGNRKIFDDIVTDVSDIVDHIAIGFFKLHDFVTLGADGAGTSGIGGEHILEFVRVDTIALRLSFARVLFHGNFVVCCRPCDDEAEIVHGRRVYRLALFILQAKSDCGIFPRFGVVDLEDVEDDARKLCGPARIGVRASYRGTELWSIRQMATRAGAFCLWPCFVIFSAYDIDVVMTGRTGGDARELFPIFLLGASVTGFAVTKILGCAIRHDYLRVTQVAVICDFLLGADEQVRVAACHARQQFAAMNLMDQNLELESSRRSRDRLIGTCGKARNIRRLSVCRHDISADRGSYCT